MCNFFSAIFTRDGRLLSNSANIDHHSQLIELFKVHERPSHAPVQNFVRLELTPPDDKSKLLDLNSWQFHVDECEVPGWFDDDAQLEARGYMHDELQEAMDREPGMYVDELIIATTGEYTLRGGRAILFGDAVVWAERSVVECYGNSKCYNGRLCEVTAHDNATVSINNGILEAHGSSNGYGCDSAISLHDTASFNVTDGQVNVYDNAKLASCGHTVVSVYGGEVDANDRTIVSAGWSCEGKVTLGGQAIAIPYDRDLADLVVTDKRADYNVFTVTRSTAEAPGIELCDICEVVEIIGTLKPKTAKPAKAKPAKKTVKKPAKKTVKKAVTAPAKKTVKKTVKKATASAKKTAK